MKRVYKNWLVRITVGFTALLSLRLISTLLHMTTLERLYKPRDFRRTHHPEISQDILDRLPRYCQTIFGQKMDPINLVFIGDEEGIRSAFDEAGWDGAHPSTPLHLLAGFASSLFSVSYRKGPFMPLFISVGLQDLSFQKVVTGKYATRHHIRIWRTRHHVPGNKRVFVAAATYEKSFRVGFRPPFIFHHKDPNLDWERDYIVKAMARLGHHMVGDHEFNTLITSSKPARDPHGDPYYTDGRVKVIEVS